MQPINNPLSIVGIAGGLNCGKGAVAAVFHGQGYMERNFSDPLKRIVRELFNVSTKELWGPSQNRSPEVRAMLQELGTDYARKFRPNIWVDKMEESLSAFASSGIKGYKGVVVADIRFPNEIELLRSMGGKMIRIRRPGNCSHLPTELGKHSSETAIDNMPDSAFDYIIQNDGTLEDLQNTVLSIIEDINALHIK
jgi:hypothetical protein